MDNQDNQNEQDAAANQSMDAGIAAAAAPQGDPNLAKVEVPQPNAEAEHQAPSVEEKLAAQNEANLQKAVTEGGYKPEAGPNREERARILIADMEHAVAHNAPITIAMLREMRKLLGVEAR